MYKGWSTFFKLTKDTLFFNSILPVLYNYWYIMDVCIAEIKGKGIN